MIRARQLPPTVSEIVGREVAEVIAGRRPSLRGRGTMSWRGYERQKAELIRLAQEYRDADANLERVAGAHNVIGLTQQAYEDPYRMNMPAARETGIVFRELMAAHSQLVMVDQLDHHFVRREWATILDPSPEERAICARNLPLGV